MDKRKEILNLHFPSDPRWLRLIRPLVKEASLISGFSNAESAKIVLAVDEACTNIIRHTFCGSLDQELRLECRQIGKGLEFVLKDRGPVVDCKKIKHRRLEDVKPGGLGVFFIRQIMSEVKYGRTGGENYIRMVKYAQKR